MSFVYKRSGRILAATAALLAAAVFLLIISILQARRPSLTLRQNGFLGANAEAVYARAGNGLAVADRDHIALYAGIICRRERNRPDRRHMEKRRRPRDRDGL